MTEKSINIQYFKKCNEIKLCWPPGPPQHRPVRGCLLGQSMRGPALPSLHPPRPGNTEASPQQQEEEQQQQGNDSHNIYILEKDLKIPSIASNVEKYK